MYNFVHTDCASEISQIIEQCKDHISRCTVSNCHLNVQFSEVTFAISGIRRCASLISTNAPGDDLNNREKVAAVIV